MVDVSFALSKPTAVLTSVLYASSNEVSRET